VRCTSCRAAEFLALEWPDPPITDVLQALPAPEQLTRLDLCAMWRNAEDAANVLGAVKRFNRLQSLQVNLGAFKGDTPWVIWQALRLSALRGLQLLSFERVIAGKPGAEALAAALPLLTALTCLSLAGTWCIAGQGAGTWSQAAHGAAPVRCECALLAETLRTMPALAELDLSHNALGDEGLQTISPALAQLARLTDLLLMTNNFSNASAPLVAQTAAALPNLVRLLMGGNKFDSRMARLLRERLMCLSTLQVVQVAYQSQS
jgi:hypothetical protein